MASRSPRYWAVVPAAGVGARMGVDVPKQYLSLAGVTVLQRSVEALLACRAVSAVAVALSPDDARWPTLSLARDGRIITVHGGARRCDSVLAGLRGLATRAAAADWVLVHDAARPCLPRDDLLRLIEALAEEPVGGLLALPVTETVKRADAADRVVATVPRDNLWFAQTPQLFRYGLLRDALEDAADATDAMTDEAAAMERAGFSPRLVPGSARNIKITRPEDLRLAEHFLTMEAE